MAQALTWQARASGEFFEILARVEQDSPSYANRISDRFEARAESLRHHPRQGRKLPRHKGSREIREVFVHRWRMIYEVTENGIVILAIIHGARLLENTEPLQAIWCAKCVPYGVINVHNQHNFQEIRRW